MKKIGAFLMLCVAATLTGCWEKESRSNSNEPVLRYHFAGMKAVLQGTNGTRLQKVWGLPDTIALREEALDKLSTAPYRALKAKLAAGVPDEAAMVKPLLLDLVNSEHFLQAKSASDKIEFVLGAKLAKDRVKVWDTHLQKIASDWKFVKTASKGGWDAKSALGHIGFSKAGDWTLVSFGSAQKSALLEELAAKPNNSPLIAGNLGDAILDVSADLPRLRKWIPALAEYPLPPAELRVLGRGENLRTEARLKYSQNLRWTPEPWVLPKKAISDPMISFTVGQGLTHLLSESQMVKGLGLKQLPNQFCMWALQHNFPMTYLAIPASNATNLVNQLAQTFPKQMGISMPGHMGEFFWTSNRAELSWRSLPFITPKVYAHAEDGKQFVMAELYPRPPLTNPPPPELFNEIQSKSKLLYYDWEFTQERLSQANQLYQLYDIVNHRRPYGTNVTAQRWLLSLAPNLGNTITEVTLSAPKEVSLVRKSHVGLTSLELVTLARWINSSNFPFEFEPAPPVKRRPTGTAPANKPGNTNAPQKGGANPSGKSGSPAASSSNQ